MDGGDNCTLLIRKLPGWLKTEDKESLLKHFGALEVTVMSNKGSMRNCAFARFSSPGDAKLAMVKLHQLAVFGCRLVVVYATPRDTTQGSVEDRWGCDALKKEKSDNGSSSSTSLDPPPALSVSHLPQDLSYLYPPPDQLIISNICNAISCVPKLYVQVLHLMNKMNLPPPFGPPTPTPVLPPGPACQSVTVSSEESEIESDEDSKRAKPQPLRPRKSNKRAKRRFFQSREMDVVPPSKSYRVDEAFPDYTLQKRLQINAPDELNVHSYQAPHPDAIIQITESSQTDVPATSQAKLQDEANGSHILDMEESEKFASLSELELNRISSEEMKETNVFKNYKPGEVSMRLYVKNLAKQVAEKDLRYIFGRYVDWKSEAHVNSFDIRLMQQGRMKGQAFIGMPSEEIAEQALQETNGYILHGKPMVVQFARSTKAKETDKIMISSIMNNS